MTNIFFAKLTMHWTVVHRTIVYRTISLKCFYLSPFAVWAAINNMCKTKIIILITKAFKDHSRTLIPKAPLFNTPQIERGIHFESRHFLNVSCGWLNRGKITIILVLKLQVDTWLLWFIETWLLSLVYTFGYVLVIEWLMGRTLLMGSIETIVYWIGILLLNPICHLVQLLLNLCLFYFSLVCSFVSAVFLIWHCLVMLINKSNRLFKLLMNQIDHS